MPRPNVFALQESGLGPFLFAEVGIEINGSGLTILSVLARLGEDPWAEAARWARLPGDTIIELLSQRIAQMPLCPQALADARATAARLMPLLPGHERQSGTAATTPGGPLAARIKGRPMVVLYLALALGLAFNLVMLMEKRAAIPAAPVTQQTAAPVTPGSRTWQGQ